jgi:phosphatidylserine/phosphatidylglycerophosphate/cardiolipin synthase-like enzyme
VVLGKSEKEALKNEEQGLNNVSKGKQKESKEEIKAKLAVLKMKASLLRASATVERAPLAIEDGKKEAGGSKREVGIQTEQMVEDSGGGPDPRRLGIATTLLDGMLSQEKAVSLVEKAVGSVGLLAYTFDRSDLVDALVGARRRGSAVTVGVDRRFSLNGRCRDQEQCLRRLTAEGVVVRLLDGGPTTEHYRQVGRAQAGLGIAHAKLLVVELQDSKFAIIGSTNWTTSSRANLEAGLLVQLTDFGFGEIWAMISGRMSRGIELLPALRSREAASIGPRRSKSATRARHFEEDDADSIG